MPIYTSDDNVDWKPLRPEEGEMLKFIRKHIPGYGDPLKNGSTKVAIMRLLPKYFHQRFMARGGQEGKGAMKPQAPVGHAFTLAATDYSKEGTPVYYRFAPAGQLPKQIAKTAVSVEWDWPQSSKNYGPTYTFSAPRDTEELFFLLKWHNRISTTERTTRLAMYYFDVPEKQAEERVKNYQERRAFEYTYMEELDASTISSIRIALGLPEYASENEERVALLDFGEKSADNKKRLLDLTANKKYRNEMLLIGELKGKNLIELTPTGWYYAKGDKKKPFVNKPISDTDLARQAANDEKLRNTLEGYLKKETEGVLV